MENNTPEKSNIDKAVKLSMIGGALLAGFSFFYYFVIFLPQKEQARIEESAEMEEKRDICLRAAKAANDVLWNMECADLGREENCELPPEIADPMDDNLRYVRDECFKKYPQMWWN